MVLCPLAETPAPVEAFRQGICLNQPLRVVSTDVHDGSLPSSGQLLRIEPQSAVLSALKKAEDDDALLLRVLDTAGEKTEVNVSVGPGLAEGIEQAVEVDLLERPISGSAAQSEGRSVCFDLDSRAIGTLLVRLAGRAAARP